MVNTLVLDKKATHTGTQWNCCTDLPFWEYLYMYLLSYHCCPWKPGFAVPTHGPALSRIWNKLHRGYALAMVTPPKRCRGAALSPWLPINPSKVVWFLQFCSSLPTFRCRTGALRTCSTVLLQLVERVFLFEVSEYSETTYNGTIEGSLFTCSPG